MKPLANYKPVQYLLWFTLLTIDKLGLGGEYSRAIKQTLSTWKPWHP